MENRHMPRSHALRALNWGASLFAGGALVIAWAAWLHMREAIQAHGVICGVPGGPAHCPACYASVALATMAAACFTLGRAAARLPKLSPAKISA